MSPPQGSLTFYLLKSTRLPRGAYHPRDLESLARFVLKAELVRGPVELVLSLTRSAPVQALNRHFRGVDRPTDVIAFCYAPPPELQGDIAINVPQAEFQAHRVGHSLRRELRLLFIHGILHLLGYADYEARHRRRMFQRQNSLLRRWEEKTS